MLTEIAWFSDLMTLKLLRLSVFQGIYKNKYVFKRRVKRTGSRTRTVVLYPVRLCFLNLRTYFEKFDIFCNEDAIHWVTAWEIKPVLCNAMWKSVLCHTQTTKSQISLDNLIPTHTSSIIQDSSVLFYCKPVWVCLGHNSEKG